MPKKKLAEKLHLNHPVMIAGGVLMLLVLAFGVGMLLSWWQHRTTQPKSNTTAGITGLPQKILPQSVVAAQHLSAQGDYSKAVASTNDALKTASSSDEKYDLYIEQGLAYENQQKLQDALAAYQHAVTINSTYGSNEAVGRVAQALGNTQLAISSYHTALSLIDNNSPGADSKKADLTDRLKAMGAQ